MDSIFVYHDTTFKEVAELLENTNMTKKENFKRI